MSSLPEIVQPHHLDGITALMAACNTPLHRLPDERDTAFVKRIVCSYINAHIVCQAATVELAKRRT